MAPPYGGQLLVRIDGRIDVVWECDHGITGEAFACTGWEIGRDGRRWGRPGPDQIAGNRVRWRRASGRRAATAPGEASGRRGDGTGVALMGH